MKKEKKNENLKEDKKIKKNKKRKWLKRILLTFLILTIVLIGIFAGLIVGISTKYAITKEDLVINYSNSVIVDGSENVIATLSGEENRTILSKNQMGEYLPKAFVAIEDKRFYTHNGVDLKRTTGAIVNFAFNRGTSSYGGSTITQQLVKNITDEKADEGIDGAIRKIKEIVRAYQVENILSKDQILELYMNRIYLGGNVYGVGMASQYYFSKDTSELSLAESAFIAGVTHTPNSYNPFSEKTNTKILKSRPKTVLGEMLKLEYISQEQYNEACTQIDNGLNFKKGSVTSTAAFSSHTEALINQTLQQLVSEKGMDKEYARIYLYGSGLTIYSTQKSDIQSALESEYSNSKYQVTATVTKTVNGEQVKEKEDAQSAMVIIEQNTGYVVGSIGVLGKKGALELNRATQSIRQPGSTMKPIGVYGPALQEGIITASSVYDDVPIRYGTYTPGNSYSHYKGLSNMRQAMKYSQNTIAVQVLNNLKPATAISYLRKMGVSSLTSSDENLSLALGGITYGITPLEMAAAYATIANNGVYITPTFYTKIVDSNGKIILEANQKKETVFSEENAYILKQLLIEPTQSGGTAASCRISNMSTAAKTGTTDSNKDKWLCGFTPYYTAATWYGYDTPTVIRTAYATTIWKNVMANIHKGLEGKSFEKPENIVTATVCRDSGLIATDICKNDVRGGRTYTEYFVKGTVPNKTCTCHAEVSICKNSNCVATDNCKNTEKKVFITRTTEKSVWERAIDAEYMLPTTVCDKCQKDENGPEITLNGNSIVTIKIDETYKEEGAKAVDNIDGDVTSKIIISGTVNNKVAGSYTITYTVSDTSGNVSTITRTVKVEEKNNTNTMNNTISNSQNVVNNTTE